MKLCFKTAFKIIDANFNKYDDLINEGYLPITGDTGDCLFGTTFASQLYYTWKQYTNSLSSNSIASIENKIKYVRQYCQWAIKFLLLKYKCKYGRTY